MNTFAFRFRQSRSCRWRSVSRKVCGVAHAVKSRWFDSENRVAGYALTNSLGRGVTATLAYDGSRMSGITFALPNGGTFSTALTRNAARPDLVTRRAYSANGSSIYSYDTSFDLLGRPANATDSQSLARSYLYNRRNELAAATIGTNAYEYAYDTIGNRTAASANSVTNTFAANNLNQYTQVDASQLTYDADGNLTQDDRFAYAYDAENRLLSVRPIAPVEGALAVANRYDHKHRRIEKVVERFNGEDWQTVETHAFVYDGGNIVLEKIALSDGTTRIVEYFWGNDLSGSEQGAGGVGGLLAVSIDGVFYFPCYDQIGNVVCYVSEAGTIAAQYVYDPCGNVIDQYGALAGAFSIRFSTKYTDSETGLISYLRRFYRADHGRWLYRDPIEEEGGENLYVFCGNSSAWLIDNLGLVIVNVVTPRRKTLGNGYSFPQVKVVDDINVRDMNSKTQDGAFVAFLNVDPCEITLTVEIYLDSNLVEKGNPDTTYYYTTHDMYGDGGLTSTSDGSPQVRGGISAHEKGHALAYLTSFLSAFKSRIASRFGDKRLSQSDMREVESIYNTCLDENAPVSSALANEGHTGWYRDNGYKTGRK